MRPVITCSEWDNLVKLWRRGMLCYAAWTTPLSFQVAESHFRNCVKLQLVFRCRRETRRVFFFPFTWRVLPAIHVKYASPLRLWNPKMSWILWCSTVFKFMATYCRVVWNGLKRSICLLMNCSKRHPPSNSFIARWLLVEIQQLVIVYKY